MVLDGDAEMSDDESNKRSRSKFSSERDDGEEITKDSTISAPSVAKRPRKDYDMIRESPSVPEDDFAALLQKHEQRKQLSSTHTQDSQHNNPTNNNNKNNLNKRNYNSQPTNNNKNNNNRNNNRNNNNNRNKNNRNNNNNNNNNNKNNKRHNQPITISRFEKELVSLPPLSDDIMAEKITIFLHETNSGLITVIISVLGISETLKYVKETAKIEEAGGMMTSDKYRRRSPGGCFFYLVKEGVTADQRKEIFTDERGKRAKVQLKPKKHTKKQNNKPTNTNTDTTNTNTPATEAQPNNNETNNNNENNGGNGENGENNGNEVNGGNNNENENVEDNANGENNENEDNENNQIENNENDNGENVAQLNSDVVTDLL